MAGSGRLEVVAPVYEKINRIGRERVSEDISSLEVLNKVKVVKELAITTEFVEQPKDERLSDQEMRCAA